MFDITVGILDGPYLFSADILLEALRNVWPASVYRPAPLGTPYGGQCQIVEQRQILGTVDAHQFDAVLPVQATDDDVAARMISIITHLPGFPPDGSVMVAEWADCLLQPRPTMTPAEVLSLVRAGTWPDRWRVGEHTRPRHMWLAPASAPRPQYSSVQWIDMAEHTATLVPQPGVLYRVRLADGTEVDYYTNALGQICYVETAQARVGCRNAVLERPYPAATFVVHPTAGMDRQHSHVLRTDDRGRLTLALVETLAPTHDPLTDLFGRGTELVTVPAMFAAVRTPTADPFGPLASELAQAVNQGSAVGLRITAVHDDSAGTSIQVEWTIDGQPGTQTIATR